MPALAPGQTRVVPHSRAFTGRPIYRRVRRRAFGLFLIFGALAALTACAGPDSHALAARLDANGRTGVYAWLVDYDPSAIVTNLDPNIVRRLAPDARFVAAAGPDPCAEAIRGHALWLRVGTRRRETGKRSYDAALDCGVALFRDAGGLVIAPR